MKLKELKKKLRKDPKYLKAEYNSQWDMPFLSGRAVFFILMQSGMTQTQLAKKVGIVPHAISRAERHGCQLTLLNKLAKVAGLRLEIKVLKANIQTK